jgi:uncharacterized membrane protein
LTTWSVAVTLLWQFQPTFIGDFVSEQHIPRPVLSTAFGSLALLMLAGHLSKSRGVVLAACTWGCIITAAITGLSLAAAATTGAHSSIYALNWALVAAFFMLYVIMLRAHASAVGRHEQT